MMPTSTPSNEELHAAMAFLQAVRSDPSLLQYFEETILSLSQLSQWAQSLGYALSDDSLARALQVDARFRWAAASSRSSQAS